MDDTKDKDIGETGSRAEEDVVHHDEHDGRGYPPDMGDEPSSNRASRRSRTDMKKSSIVCTTSFPPTTACTTHSFPSHSAPNLCLLFFLVSFTV